VRAEAPKSPPTIEMGTHVRALAGPFAGQVGVVQELDGKGAARVLFGLLAARVELGDLTLHSSKRGRPVMQSSHRKPSK
jgi:transcription antitermination factor NusG